MTTEAEQRARVVAEAHTWVGTPYRDMGEVKGPHGGTDCAKLLKLVYHNAGLIPPIEVGAYSPQWFLHQDAELYMGRVKEHAREIAETEAKPGDVVLYKIGRCFAHGAIIIDPGWPAIIHAHVGSRMVVRGRGLDGHLGKPKRERKFFTLW